MTTPVYFRDKVTGKLGLIEADTNDHAEARVAVCEHFQKLGLNGHLGVRRWSMGPFLALIRGGRQAAQKPQAGPT